MVSDLMKEKFDSEVLKIVKSCKQKAEKLLAANKGILDKLANEILAKETLTEDEIGKITGIEITQTERA